MQVWNDAFDVLSPDVRRMRICLIGDTHGFVPGLEAALAACRRHAHSQARKPW